MSLSEKSILEFKELLEKTYNVKVTKEYAEEAAENLLNFYRILLKVDKNQQGRKTASLSTNTPPTEAVQKG